MINRYTEEVIVVQPDCESVFTIPCHAYGDGIFTAVCENGITENKTNRPIPGIPVGIDDWENHPRIHFKTLQKTIKRGIIKMTRKMIIYGLLCLLLAVTLLTGCGGGNGGVSDVTNGLVTYYPFNGNANDAVGSVDATSVGSGVSFAAQDRFGNSNKACSFDGTINGNITMTTITLEPSTGFSVSMWIKSSCNSGTPVYGPPLAFYQQDESIDFEISSDLAINGPLPSNIWTHIVGIYDNNSKTGSLYINGELIDSYTRTNDALDSINLNGFSFGAWWTGVIDDFRIYNRVLTTSEIRQLYQYPNN